MGLFILRRTLRGILALLCVTVVMFALVQAMPQDAGADSAHPLTRSGDGFAPPPALEPPSTIQLLALLVGALRLEPGPALGRSASGQAVGAIIGQRLPITLQVGGLALLLGGTLGLLLGTWAAARPKSWVDRLAGAVALWGRSVPVIVLGPVLVMIFVVMLDWLPVVDVEGVWLRTLTQPWTIFSGAYLRLALLPVGSIGISVAAVVTRHLRESLSPVRRGAPPHPVRRRALILLVVALGPLLTLVVFGGFIVEPLFNVPGIGGVFVSSLAARDYNLLLGVMMVYALGLVAGSMVIDVLVSWLDPRVRWE